MRPEHGLRAAFHYRNHRGEERLRHVVLTGRLSAGPTEWHPDAAWTFEAWCRDADAMRWFDPRGVLAAEAELLPRIFAASAERDARITRERDDARQERRAAVTSFDRERERALDYVHELHTTRGVLRRVLAGQEALERRRDELLETANRYLERARRMRAAIEHAWTTAQVTDCISGTPDGDLLAADLDRARDACRAD